MKRFRISLNDQEFKVEILSDPRLDLVEVCVDGETFHVSVSPLEEEIRLAERITSEPQLGAPELAGTSIPRIADCAGVTSPLPGTIIKVMAQSGQRVNTGDGILVIEAMKMNNQISSPRTGTIGEMLVREGQQVSHGEPLFTWAELPAQGAQTNM